MRYSKPPLDISQPLQQLQDRGLAVDFQPEALNALSRIGYYRLSSYWLFFEEPPSAGQTRSHCFRPGSSFHQLIERYNTARILPLLVIDAVDRIENAARTACAQAMSMMHRPPRYLCQRLFQADFSHIEQIHHLRAQLQ